MLWFRKELVTVFALVLVTVSGWWCDVTKVTTFDEAAATGTQYTVLSSHRFPMDHLGYNNSDEHTGGQTVLKFKLYMKMFGSCHFEKETECIITGNHCSGNDTNVYIIAAYTNFVVVYTRGKASSGKTFEIFTKSWDERAPQNYEELPPGLRTEIGKICAPIPRLYNYQVEHFIPDCLNEE